MGESTTSVLAKRPVSVQLRLLGVQSTLSERTPPQNGHLDLVPVFLYSLYLTLYKTDISLRRTLTAGPKGVRLRGSWLYSVSLSSEPSQSPCQSVCQRLKNHLSHVFTRLKIHHRISIIFLFFFSKTVILVERNEGLKVSPKLIRV